MDRFRWLLGVLVLAAAPAPAQQDLDPQRLRSLVEAGKMEQAYSLADEHTEEHAGSVRFDLYYGIAAINTGHVDVGVFALERVIMQRPGLDRARLEYARGLFLQNDDQRAREQFETVLANDPPPAVVDQVERYLVAIDRRADSYSTTVSGHLGFELGHDGNVNRAPDAQSVDSALFNNLPLAQESSDAFAGLNGRVELSRPLVPGLNLIASANADLERHGDESDFDTSRGGGRAGLRWSEGQHRLSGFLEGNRFYVGGEGYQRTLGLSGRYRYRLAERTAVHTTARLAQLRYDDLDGLDSQLAWLGVGASRSWAVNWNPRASVTLLAGQENADESTTRAEALAQRDMVELRASLGLSPAPEWTLRSSLRVRNSEYETNLPVSLLPSLPPLFDEARDETYYNLDLALDWRPEAHWRLGPSVSYTDNDANIGLYDYDRTVVGLEARYLFF